MKFTSIEFSSLLLGIFFAVGEAHFASELSWQGGEAGVEHSSGELIGEWPDGGRFGDLQTDDLRPSVLLQKAFVEFEKSDSCLRREVMSVACEQFRLNEIDRCVDTVKLYLENRNWTDGEFVPNASDLCSSLRRVKSNDELDEVLSLFEHPVFSDPTYPGTASCVDHEKSNMVAAALNTNQLELARKISETLSESPTFLSFDAKDQPYFHPVVRAQSYFAIKLIEDEQFAQAMDVVNEFTNEVARESVLRLIREEFQHDQRILKLLGERLPEQNQSQLRLATFNQSIDKKDLVAANAAMEQMVSHGDEIPGYRVAELAELFRLNKLEDDAKAILLAKLEQIDKNPDSAIGFFPLKMLADELIELGEIETVIKLCGSWRRIDQEDSRAMHGQPIYDAVCKLKKKNIHEAMRIAEEIHDPYWRAEAYDELVRPAGKYSAQLQEKVIDRGLRSARQIEDVDDRGYRIASILEEKFRSVEFTFDQLMKDVAQIESVQCRSRVVSMSLSSKVEELSDDQVRQAIKTVAAGRSDEMMWIIDGLLEHKRHQLAIEALAKISTVYDWQRMTMEKVVEHLQGEEIVDEMFEHIDSFRLVHQPALINRCFPSVSAEEKPKWTRKGMEILGKQFDLELFGKIGSYCAENNDLKTLLVLANIKNLNREELQRFGNVCQRLYRVHGARPLDDLKRSLESGAKRETLEFARFEAIVERGDHREALNRIQDINLPAYRGSAYLRLAKSVQKSLDK